MQAVASQNIKSFVAAPRTDLALERKEESVGTRDRYVSGRSPHINRWLVGGALVATGLALLPTASAYNQCDVDYSRIAFSCGIAGLNAVLCGAGGLIQCGGAVMATGLCNQAIRQACLDVCINPLSLWCC